MSSSILFDRAHSWPETSSQESSSKSGSTLEFTWPVNACLITAYSKKRPIIAMQAKSKDGATPSVKLRTWRTVVGLVWRKSDTAQIKTYMTLKRFVTWTNQLLGNQNRSFFFFSDFDHVIFLKCDLCLLYSRILSIVSWSVLAEQNVHRQQTGILRGREHLLSKGQNEHFSES